MTFLDAYTVKARIAPALLVVVPLVSVTLAWFPKLNSLPGLSALGVAGIAVLMLVAQQTRRSGRILQQELVAEWGGLPTTIILRHSDSTLRADEKARYHASLKKRVQGMEIPDSAGESRDRARADRNYAMAVDWLREHTRENPVVKSENANYGFHRNLCAIRPLGWTSSAIGIAGAIVLMALDQSALAIESMAAVTLALSVGCGLVLLNSATRAKVREAAFLYAVALIRAIDATRAS